MRISYWSSDVCSSDLSCARNQGKGDTRDEIRHRVRGPSHARRDRKEVQPDEREDKADRKEGPLGNEEFERRTRAQEPDRAKLTVVNPVAGAGRVRDRKRVEWGRRGKVRVDRGG